MAGGAPDSILKTPSGIPFKLFVDIDWSSDLAAKLLSATARLKDTSMLRRAIGRKVVLSVRRNFLEQTAPDGSPWSPLKKKRRRGHNPGAKVLLDSLKLYESITYELDEPDSVAIGFPHETFYGRFHQSGTRHIPKRPFLGLRPDDLPTTQQLLTSHASEAFGAAA